MLHGEEESNQARDMLTSIGASAWSVANTVSLPGEKQTVLIRTKPHDQPDLIIFDGSFSGLISLPEKNSSASDPSYQNNWIKANMHLRHHHAEEITCTWTHVLLPNMAKWSSKGQKILNLMS